MIIFQVVGLGLVATVLLVLLRQKNPELGVLLSITAGAVLFMIIVAQIGPVLDVFNDLASRAEINLYYVNSLLKIIGVAYVAEFGAQICRDAQEGAMASKIEIAAKIIILVMAVPIILAVLEIILKLLPA